LFIFIQIVKSDIAYLNKLKQPYQIPLI